VTPPAAERVSSRGGLLAKLLASVRAEFRAEIYLPDPADPVFVTTKCMVDGCDRVAAQWGLCNGHVIRWRKRGRPDMAEFLTGPGRPVRGRTELPGCAVGGCRFGVNGRGLCSKHRDRWNRQGRPGLDAWIAQAVVTSAGTAECRMPFCSLWVENATKIFCKNHQYRWEYAGFPDLETFITDCQLIASGAIDLRGLGPALMLEFQYALQRRHDERTRTATPQLVSEAVHRAKAAGVSSLLDLSAREWRKTFRSRMRAGGVFLLDAREGVEILMDGTGWEVEYPRDVWRLHLLPGIEIPPGRRTERIHLRFDRITQPWLRELAKRWLRLRLASGLSTATAKAGADALTCFSRLLAAAGTSALAQVDRPLLERHLAWVNSQPGGPGVKKARIGQLNTFFQDIRRNGWDDTLPGTAAYFPGDTPPVPEKLDRRLAEYVMAQVESPVNLARWPDPAGRLVTLILIRGGLRISSALALEFDCLLHDGQGAPYLRYFNTKMKREAAVPIDEELKVGIIEQQRRVLQRWPDGTPHLFPRQQSNATGQIPLSSNSFRCSLSRWLDACEISDEHSRPVKLTPHQWRHTFACRLINRDVPQEVVRVLLDHESHRMTAHYAKITDQTVRRHWEKATKVNTKGERVTLDPDGPLAQAQWAKTRYGMTTQTLPNGYCGLPVQKSCPHANACLTCPVFLTGPEFLPELREQRHRTLTLIEVSTGKGQTRVAEMNQQVLTNLDRMIGEIENNAPQDETADAS